MMSAVAPIVQGLTIGAAALLPGQTPNRSRLNERGGTKFAGQTADRGRLNDQGGDAEAHPGSRTFNPQRPEKGTRRAQPSNTALYAKHRHGMAPHLASLIGFGWNLVDPAWYASCMRPHLHSQVDLASARDPRDPLHDLGPGDARARQPSEAHVHTWFREAFLRVARCGRSHQRVHELVRSVQCA